MRDAFRFRQLVVVAALVLVATPGRADLVPSDRTSEKPCTAPGQPCTTSDSLEGQPGICVATTCTRRVEMHTRDGGMVDVKVPCFHCVAGGPGTSKPSPKAKSSGCTAAPEPGDTGSLALMLLLIAGLTWSRRRSDSDRDRASARSGG